ncbi:MAG: hypothetical protein ACLTZT_13980 [Butyricimonas faecalis]
MDEIIYRWIADYSLGVIGREDFEQLKAWIEHLLVIGFCSSKHSAFTRKGEKLVF